MKRTCCFLLFIFLITHFTACQTRFPLAESENQIESIQIVYVSIPEENEVIQTVLAEISDIGAFMDEFRSIPCESYLGDPRPLDPHYADVRVIKIIYTNGSYELINWIGQSRYSPEYGLNYHWGYYTFDRAQFIALIDKYVVT